MYIYTGITEINNSSNTSAWAATGVFCHKTRRCWVINELQVELKKNVGSVTMSVMKTLKTLGERGELNALLLPFIILAILFCGVVGFGAWAFSSRQNYKDHTDAMIATAVAANKNVVQAADAKQYAEAAKSPLRTYIGPVAYGSVHISYPRTWSAYVDTTDSNNPLNAYFHTGYVPSVNSQQATYNLRVEVVANSYTNEMSNYQSYVSQGTAVAAPYSLPKVPTVVGTRFSGAVFPDNPNASGTIILLPLRNTTLEIWIESNDYLHDFNTYVLPNLSFSP